MTTTSRSDDPAVPSSELELFTLTGQWTEVDSDREGRRCVTQDQQGVTLRAYFNAGALAEMAACLPSGEVVELEAAVVARLAEGARRAAGEDPPTPGTRRRSTRLR